MLEEEERAAGTSPPSTPTHADSPAPPATTPPTDTTPTPFAASTPTPGSSTSATPGPSTSTTVHTPSTPDTSMLELRQQLFRDKFPDLPTSDDQKILISMSQLRALVSGYTCRHCEGEIKLKTSQDRFDTTLQSICEGCEEEATIEPRRAAPLGGNSQEITKMNIIMTYESLISNLGFAGLNRIAGAMGFPVFSKGKYFRHTNYLYQAMDAHYKKMMEEGIKGIFHHYETAEDVVPDDTTGLLDVEVSFDGNWMIRGHKSHIGVGVVIEVNTGIVIDLEVLSNFCPTCTKKENKLSKNDFRTWYQEHRNTCYKNFEGNAGAMEAEAAVRMWSRSSQMKLRYTTFVGDGDSSAFNAVCALNDGEGPYDVPVVKEECVNHVSKRLGARLRKLKKEDVTITKTKTGKTRRMSTLGGASMLTDSVIDNLTRYYGKAVRDSVNTSVDDIRGAIMSGFFRNISTDARPIHHRYPAGEDSWCFYRRAEAKGETPPSHKQKKPFRAKIPQDKLKGIRDVYTELTRTDLLSRCLKGRTQKSLHSKLWTKCSKSKFAGLHRVHFASQLTALEHNFGYKKSSLLFHLGFEVPNLTTAALMKQEPKVTPKRPEKRKISPSDTGMKDYGPGMCM